MDVAPGGGLGLFAQISASKLPGPCPGGVGLTTALVALRSGFVIVGSLPTAGVTLSATDVGCLIVLNSQGKMVSTITGFAVLSVKARS